MLKFKEIMTNILNTIKTSILLFCFLMAFGCNSKDDTTPSKELKQTDDSIISVVFYNVENLFDTENDPETADDDFTPDGKLQWNSKRYSTKIKNISKVLSSIELKNGNFPEIIGLCEIENRKVLEDLINSDMLKDGKYKIVHSDSPDFRGIDNALLYKSDFMSIIHTEAIPVKIITTETKYSRDILYVEGVADKDTLHLFVNHWSSRREGIKESENKRINAAQILRKKVDEIFAENSNAKIIIMGDMNDEPTNKSIAQVLNAKFKFNPNAQKKELVNLMYPYKQTGKGSYNFKGKWNMLDNMILSQSLLHNTSGLHCNPDDAYIFSADWMLFNHPKYGLIPSRTLGGTNYYGGYSDHLPIFIKLNKI